MSRQIPTLEDVAREAGVSRATVSRVVNGVRNVDPGIQDLVRHAIDRTGYAPNRAARALVTRRAGTVALIVSGAGDAFAARVFADPFFGRVVSGVLGHLRANGTHPVLMFAESEQARGQAVDYLRQGGADGALVVSIQAADPLPHLLVSAGVPIVLFARPELPQPVSHVDLDHYAGARLAAEHLLTRGAAGSPRSAPRRTSRPPAPGSTASATPWPARACTARRSPRARSPSTAVRWR